MSGLRAGGELVLEFTHLARLAAFNRYQFPPSKSAKHELRTDTAFDLLTNFVIFSASIFYMLGVAAVIVLRFREPNRRRTYRTWGYPLVPIAFLSVYAWFLTQVYRENPLESRTGLVLIAAGVPVYFVYQWKARRMAGG